MTVDEAVEVCESLQLTIQFRQDRDYTRADMRGTPYVILMSSTGVTCKAGNLVEAVARYLMRER
jgi:signal recognition particle subunit SEC65